MVAARRADDCSNWTRGNFNLLDSRRPPEILLRFRNFERSKRQRISNVCRYSIKKSEKKNRDQSKMSTTRVQSFLRQRTVRRISSKNIFYTYRKLKSQFSPFKCTETMIADCIKSVNKCKTLSEYLKMDLFMINFN